MHIILGNLGSCTDIITAVIDNRGVNLHADGYYLWFNNDRLVLQQDLPKGTDWLPFIESSTYKSLETYCQKIRIEPNTKKYSYITVDSSNQKATAWVINRMDNMYPSHRLTPITLKNSAVVNRYYSDLTLYLEDILEGKLIDKLKEYIDSPLDEKLYYAYLSLLLDDYPFN
jgi:hypothetical protein